MKLAVAGCPRNCAEALVKDVGVVAVDGGRWEIYVGGAAGAHVRKGDLLATVDDPDEVITLTGRFLQYYRENAKWLERTYDFVPRVGHRRAHGDRRRRQRRASPPAWTSGCRRSIDAYRDPWQDGREPRRPGQFRTSLPLLPLPIVPVGRAPDGSLQASSAGRGPAASGPFASGSGNRVRVRRSGSAGMTTSEITEHAVAAADDLPPAGRGRTRSATRWWRCSGCGPGSCGRSTRCARTPAARWRTGSSTRRRSICPLHNYFFSLADGTCLNGDYAVRTYPVREEAGRSSSTRRFAFARSRLVRRATVGWRRLGGSLLPELDAFGDVGIAAGCPRPPRSDVGADHRIDVIRLPEGRSGTERMPGGAEQQDYGSTMTAAPESRPGIAGAAIRRGVTGACTCHARPGGHGTYQRPVGATAMATATRGARSRRACTR